VHRPINHPTLDIPDTVARVQSTHGPLWQTRIWENLVEQSNATAKNHTNNDRQPRAMGRRWKPASIPETKASVAITIVMGGYGTVWQKQGKALGPALDGPLFLLHCSPAAIRRYLFAWCSAALTHHAAAALHVVAALCRDYFRKWYSSCTATNTYIYSAPARPYLASTLEHYTCPLIRPPTPRATMYAIRKRLRRRMTNA